MNRAALAGVVVAACAIMAGCSAESVSTRAVTTSSSSAGSPVTSTPPTSSPGTSTSAASDPAAEIRAATATAAAAGKRVLIDFGADWCPDCRSLDAFYTDPAVAPILAADFVLVRVDVGHFDQNMDVSHQYGDAAASGIPALAVLDADGTMVVNTADGSFANARDMDPQSVAEFLTTWRPPTSR